VVTGATGRIGAAVFAALSSDPDFEVIPFVSPAAAPSDGVAVDVADRAAFARAVRDVHPDVVIHLAARRDGGAAATEVNVGSVETIVASTADAGIHRIVFASSAAVYGDSGTRPSVESDELAPASDYGRSKVAAELALADAACETVALRIFNVFGPGFDDSLVSRLLRATPDEPASLRGMETFVRDYVHVSDVVAAIRAAALVSLPEPHVVLNVGTGVALSNVDMVAALGGDRLNTAVVDWPRSYSVADVSRAHAVLGVVASVPVTPVTAAS
jgi:UDP-glucose 4-epimerase